MVGGALGRLQDLLVSYSQEFGHVSIMFFWFFVVFATVRIAIFAVRRLFRLSRPLAAMRLAGTADTAISLLAAVLLWTPAEFVVNLAFQVDMGIDEKDMEGCARLDSLADFTDCAQTMALVVVLQSQVTVLCGIPLVAVVIFYLARRRLPPLSPIYTMIALTMLLQSILVARVKRGPDMRSGRRLPRAGRAAGAADPGGSVRQPLTVTRAIR